MKDKKTLLIVLVAALLAIIAFLTWQTFHKSKQMKEMEEVMNFEKEELQNEYEELALEFDGYQSPNIKNDSLVELLAKEKNRVQDLLEELRITKATDAKKIASLKKELATVRTVMVQYVHQIDSLDRTNKKLKKENEQVRQQIEVVSQANEQLQTEKTQLTAVVNRAAMMEITAFKCTPLNKYEKEAKRVSKITKLQINYTIGKNVTAAPGVKTVYVRLVTPSGDLLTTSEKHLFHYEDQLIGYSLCKDFEYTSDALSDVLFWNVQEELAEGIYNADFFIDGNLCGSFPIRID